MTQELEIFSTVPNEDGVSWTGKLYEARILIAQIHNCLQFSNSNILHNLLRDLEMLLEENSAS